ncbi:uncharacterized protein B0I36DRAFT_411067 [Microdochium trichocladiopsis]|uniref:AMP-dependent synthetase/ligase domain-containing protein n=1 Tax=Microdochium trichocladiopsis TaxID=1682393 RepID=A0A9P8Y6V7_9PEZI|nr:uncharacterized protein B0I36DRAFT_411067 [Microdochium trichocladiopsis]KAH7029241.1 hypothetical protein B0I36DRAFT_411067 [Microdochium trichocladiopsis]
MAETTERGRRLIPRLVDELARTEPSRIVYSIPLSGDISQGFREVSARGFADAVNKTAWWLHETVDRSESFETITYIGPHDLRYSLLILATIKVGFKLLLLSPNNSKEGAAACLDATQCRLWAQPQGRPRNPLLTELLVTHELQIIDVPPCEELLDAAGTRHYPYTKTFEEAAKEPFCVLHSSGSTGVPKTIPVTHGLIATQDAMKLLQPVKGHESLTPWAALFDKGARIYSPNAIIHATAIIVNLLSTFFFETHCIMSPVDVEPTMDLFAGIADHGNVDIWFVSPQYINDLAQAPRTLAKVKRSRFIATAGGPMSPESGAAVNEQIRVFNMTGTSEGFMSSVLLVDPADFLYFAWHPNSVYDFREVEPGIYEHWIVRDPAQDLYQGIFYTFPDAQEVNLKDLYVKHPAKPDHWLYYGRNDDIVALSDGFKITPSDIQATIADHPAVKDCLMVGVGQPAPGLLVELSGPKPRDPVALQGLIDSIQEFVKKADNSSLYKGYLHKDCLILADPARPFVRTDKLTVKRRETLALYEQDIDRFYRNRQSGVAS